MKLVMTGLGVVAALVAAVLAAGYLLPQTRQGSAERVLAAPPELVRATILDIDSQPRWRARVAAVERTGGESWTETTADGERIAFRRVAADPDALSLAFDSTRGYSGTGDAALGEAPGGGTLLRVRERATTPSPVGRLLSRLFFDPEAFAAAYLDELDAEVRRRLATER